MVFSSLVFLCVFLVGVFLLYTVMPSLKVKNALLIIASLGFYAYGEPVYVFLMLLSSVMNYLYALWIARTPERKNRLAVVIAIVANLGLLVIFKYSGMLVETMNALFGSSLPAPQIALPIGISFFTFQALSYVIDVYRGVVKVQRNFFYVLLYISFFPQLIAGPIVKYRDIQDMIIDRRQDVSNIARGFRRFICGLAKKVLIADTMGQVVDIMYSTPVPELCVLTAWLGAIAYIFQIYYDFSGYSDMALGLGMMFGFKFKENFNYPYSALNVQDFWRRWHISLSTWFKEYLYIPLGRQQERQTARSVQSHRGLLPVRLMARCKLDVRGVGSLAWPIPLDRGICPWAQEAAEVLRASLYDARGNAGLRSVQSGYLLVCARLFWRHVLRVRFLQRSYGALLRTAHAVVLGHVRGSDHWLCAYPTSCREGQRDDLQPFRFEPSVEDRFSCALRVGVHRPCLVHRTTIFGWLPSVHLL